MLAVPGFARAKKWSSCEVNSFIFVWYHAQKEQPSWTLAPLSQLALNQWRYRGRNEFYISAHIQVRQPNTSLKKLIKKN